MNPIAQFETNEATQRTETLRADGFGKELVEESEPHSNVSTGSLRYLEPEEFPIWDALVEVSPQCSPFSRSWWLKAVGGTVRILGYFKDGNLLGGIPLYSEKRSGVTLYTMPKLTQTLGPILAPLSGKQVNGAWQEMEILSALAKQLAKHSIFFQAFHPNLQNWSPFYWNGFRQTSRATQILNLRAPNKIWDGMAKNARRCIRRAERMGVIVKPCTPEDVWHAEEMSFTRQHMKVTHSAEYLRELYCSAKDNNAGECFAAVDSQEQVHAAIFVIWDGKRTIGVAAGSDPELRASGGMSLLMWHCMQFAAERSEIFDFGGSVLQPVELFQRGFGAVQVPYVWIMKFPLWLQVYLTLRRKI
jgi:lipid II:glycine glycyltransferase (peptidoglycan interpeptide bridge formation enzyme)